MREKNLEPDNPNAKLYWLVMGHKRVNDLLRVITQPPPDFGSEPRPVDDKSDTHTVPSPGSGARRGSQNYVKLCT